jgi:hypothetical protein
MARTAAALQWLGFATMVAGHLRLMRDVRRTRKRRAKARLASIPHHHPIQAMPP